MARDINSSPERRTLKSALSTRDVLVAVLLSIVLTLTGTSLLLVWRRIRQQVTADLSVDLQRSSRAFQSAEFEGFSTLQREAALLADLPSLKALLTTNDDLTIQNAAADFWKTSGGQLFALADLTDHVRAVYTSSNGDTSALSHDLGEALRHAGQGYLLSRDQLYRYTTQPVYFGSAATGTLLGTVVTGYQLDTAYLVRMSSALDANAAFISGSVPVSSSLPTVTGGTFLWPPPQGSRTDAPAHVLIRNEPYLATGNDLSTRANVPLQVVFFRSLRPAELEIHDISRQLILLGATIVLLGWLVMLFVARRLTAPLELLARRVKAFGDNEDPEAAGEQLQGTREVQQLTLDFLAMRTRVQDSNRARLESERLATIGSMAASVSHDLRHHLASIYANAEFLAAPDATVEERGEFFQDIQAAVMGTTEMLESLTVFSRTGQAARHAPEQMQALLERAITQVRMHPAASRVALRVVTSDTETAVFADGRQIERALFNLLLNGCQSRRPPERPSIVTATLEVHERTILALIRDNGTGIPAEVQNTLFDPFVSSGKQNGTGLGLTLARRIAEDHGGQVDLLFSNSEETVFQFRLPLRCGAHDQPPGASNG